MDDATRRRLAELKSECGCNAGSAALLLSVGAFVIYSVWLDPVMRSLGERVLIGMGIGLAGMLMGKILGIAWARYQYRKLLRDQGQAATSSAGSFTRDAR
jgi:hypothetical protein